MADTSNSPPMPEEPINDGIYQRSGRITFRVGHFRDFAEGNNQMKSRSSEPPNFINALPWSIRVICVSDGAGNKCLRTYLECIADKKDKAWSCSALVEFSAKLKGKCFKKKSSRVLFSSVKRGFGYSWDLKEFKKAFYDAEEDAATVVVDIVAEEPRGMTGVRNDSIVRVNGTPVNINKHNLAAHSNYFQTLFFGENAPEEPTIQVDDLPDGVKHFKRMIATMYPENRELDDECIEPVLHLANQFLVNCVENECVKFLIEKSEKSPIFKFRLADKYSIVALKADVLASMTTSDFCNGKKFWENSTERSKLSEEAAQELKNRCEELFPEPAPKRARMSESEVSDVSESEHESESEEESDLSESEDLSEDEEEESEDSDF